MPLRALVIKWIAGHFGMGWQHRKQIKIVVHHVT
jgi:hypothetical protein